MSRHRSSGSSGHWIDYYVCGYFKLGWSVDRYYPGSRLRHPRRCSRITDLNGAERFLKKWRSRVTVTDKAKAYLKSKGVDVSCVISVRACLCLKR